MPKDILVSYQKNAWFDTDTCMAYAKALRMYLRGCGECLLGLDNLTSHASPRFKSHMREKADDALLLFTLEDCTDLRAVTDHGMFSSSRLTGCFEQSRECVRFVLLQCSPEVFACIILYKQRLVALSASQLLG